MKLYINQKSMLLLCSLPSENRPTLFSIILEKENINLRGYSSNFLTVYIFDKLTEKLRTIFKNEHFQICPKLVLFVM